jgi:hypothetical protein
VCVIGFGVLRVQEFVVGNDPTTNFNKVAHNLTDVGELDAEDIFGFALLIGSKTVNEKTGKA